jgi:hypothetical protein
MMSRTVYYAAVSVDGFGAGTPVFEPGTRMRLELVETRPFPNGVVMLRYTIAPDRRRR